MSRFDEYQKLKRERDELARDAERKRAALDHELSRAHDEFDAADAAVLVDLLKRKKKELAALERDHMQRVAEFKKTEARLHDEEE